MLKKAFRHVAQPLRPPSPAQLTNDGIPNISPEWLALRDLDVMRFNIKQNGYALGRMLIASLAPVGPTQASDAKLPCKPSTQADIEADWAAHWFAELKVARIYHRKIWEYAYVLQALHSRGMLCKGTRGLGFGCGQEPLPSYFASRGIKTVVTDLDPSRGEAKAWRGSNQHTETLASAHHPHLVDVGIFHEHTTLEYADMNRIPGNLRGFDFCWSICALEHLGSIARGLNFIENAIETLRPGGLAVHTTEFNYTNDQQTIDNWPTVLFQKVHFEEIASRLGAKGHIVAPLDFNPGSDPMDLFVDVPPYWGELTANGNNFWVNQSHRPDTLSQLKLAIDGFPSTCFGFIVERRS